MQASSLSGITSVLKQVARSVTKKLSVTEKLSYEKLAQPYLYLRVSEKGLGVMASNCRVLLDGEKLTIGRNSVNNLCLMKSTVSRFHAVIEATEGSYWLTDVGSGQGTFVRIPKKEQ
jgi:pSer/pThr/pTyr-binding forkhead associated (FHA) protein